MDRQHGYRWVSLAVAFLAACVLSRAYAEGVDKAQAARTEMQAAIKDANAATLHGPQELPLAAQARLKLPADFGFVPAAQAKRLLRAMGNQPGDDLLGLVVPEKGEVEWFMTVRYIAAGYIKDDDARDWNADDLLKNIREGVTESNKERAERGLPQMEVLGWVQAPRYEAAEHRLAWSVLSRDVGSAAGDDNGVNFNTLLLGREGYVGMNMVAGQRDIEGLKPTAQRLLAALEFDSGKRYADFNASTDRTAEYGLAALVAGVAAKKLGMFALMAAFFAKFAKVIGVAVIAGGAALSKLLGRKKKTDGDGVA